MATKLGSVWMPCKTKHDLKEVLRYLRGIASAKGAESFKPYAHVKGKLFSTMTRDSAEDARLAIAAASKEAVKVCPLSTWPDDVVRCAGESVAMVAGILGMRAARALGSLTLPRALADVLPIRPAMVVDASEAFRAEMTATLEEAAQAVESPAPLVFPDDHLAEVVELRGERTQIACMGCFWPELPHGCGKGQAAAQ